MKEFITCCALLLFLTWMGKSVVAQSTSDRMTTRDSILKETEFGSVYITRDRTAKMYDWLAPRVYDSTELKSVFDEEFINELLDDGAVTVQHVENDLIQGDWCSLYYFEGQFYVYSPSDWMFAERILITDSAFIKTCCADLDLRLIENYDVLKDGSLQFILSDYFDQKRQLNIAFIDPDHTVSMWTYRYDDGTDYCALKVRAEFVRAYDMIVNDCGDRKCFQEFVFEMPGINEMRTQWSKNQD